MLSFVENNERLIKTSMKNPGGYFMLKLNHLFYYYQIFMTISKVNILILMKATDLTCTTKVCWYKPCQRIKYGHTYYFQSFVGIKFRQFLLLNYRYFITKSVLYFIYRSMEIMLPTRQRLTSDTV